MPVRTAESAPALMPPLGGPILLGLAVSIITLSSVGMFATVASISGAVVAPGTVVVEGRSKQVQHKEGGIISAIFVDDGAEVSEGQVLIRLDDTQTRAKLAIVLNQLGQQTVRKARLVAERDGLSKVVFPAKTADVTDAIATEQALFIARREGLAAQRAQLAQRIISKEKEIEGLSAEIQSLDDQHAIATREHAGLNQLYEQKYVPITRILQLEREMANIRGRRGQRVAEVARAQEQIAEIGFHQTQIEIDFRRDVLGTLGSIEAKIAELLEQRAAAEDFLTRIEIRAPIAGVVQDLAVHTTGGVVRSSDTLLLIVPQNDKLVIEVRIAPQDIDQLAAGQFAVVRLTNFNRRATPELAAHVIFVSPDIVSNARSQTSYPRLALQAPVDLSQPHFVARLEINPGQIDKLEGGKLVPGMQVETFIATNERTVLSYLLKPISDRFAHAFRER